MEHGPELALLARRQAGIADIDQLRELGVSPSCVQRMRRSGLLVGAARGVYGVGHLPDTDEARWSAAVRSLGADAALSHLAAARLLGMLRWTPKRIDVTAPTWHRPVSGVVRHAMQLDDTEIVVVRGISVTNVARTIADCAQLLEVGEVIALAREARHQGSLDLPALHSYCDPARRRHGAPILREALQRLGIGHQGFRSLFEQQLRDVLVLRGAPEPAINGVVQTDIGAVEVDLFWPDLLICAEADGPTHDLEEQQRKDARQRAALQRAGLRVFPVHWREFQRDRAAATDDLMRAIEVAVSKRFQR